MSPLVTRLSEALRVENISYCHWKSNFALKRSAEGDSDLDVLIKRADAQRFTELLSRLGFKETRGPINQQLPGVLDYYAYDADTDKFIHVHAHYKLLIGHDRTKNHHLPFEDAYLASATQGEWFRVPAPAYELIVFVVRMVLKYGTWDSILSRQATMPLAARSELEYLQARANREEVFDVLKQHLPYINAMQFDACLQSLRADGPVWKRLRAGWQLESVLQAHARRQRAIDVWLKTWRRVIRGARRRLGLLPRKRLTSGGAMIAVVGGDGAGKSTAIDALYAWLAEDFDTVKVHLGKPPWSWTSYLVRGALKIVRLLSDFLISKPGTRPRATTISHLIANYSQCLRCICVARDRYQTYAKARRFATNGGIVICDRFPLAQIESMDGPEIYRLADLDQDSALIKFLARIETYWYSFIAKPDVIAVLRVDPELAVRRKTEEDPTMVRSRGAQIYRLDWRETGAYVVDASRSKKDVLSDLKNLIWSAL